MPPGIDGAANSDALDVEEAPPPMHGLRSGALGDRWPRAGLYNFIMSIRGLRAVPVLTRADVDRSACRRAEPHLGFVIASSEGHGDAHPSAGRGQEVTSFKATSFTHAEDLPPQPTVT